MRYYDHQTIERKWQEFWEERGIFTAQEGAEGKRAYVLDMFPYPSSAGLHVGHPEGYTATDIVSRYLRMKGVNVLHPMGWDAFGLPAENYAIKQGVHPRETTSKNIEIFKRQIKSLGLSFDWSRELSTAHHGYYQWTQWLFLELYKKGLAYKKKAPVNWCPECQTVLAREQVIDGNCERCKHEVVQKELEQWFFKITEYAEELLEDLDKLDWPEPIKLMQRNWIGRSEGALIKFEIRDSESEAPHQNKFDAGQANSKSEIPRPPHPPLTKGGIEGGYLEVFTTRPDTLFGATYMVLAPEHPLVRELAQPRRGRSRPTLEQGGVTNYEDVRKYIERAKKKSE